jgi:hypothetical protein
MPEQKAIHAFKHEKMNCAQSVLKAFHRSHDVSDTHIIQAGKLGGGRAPEGRCGALHAALFLAETPQARERIRQDFIYKAGAEVCSDVRKARQLTCVECVKTAAGLVAK